MEQVAERELTFAGLLRQLRVKAGLTQEELAETAGLSPRSISDLERGINRTARKDSALLLADALKLSGDVRVAFVAAARGRAPAAEVLTAAQSAESSSTSAAAATRTLPRDIASFTGRETELAWLVERLTDAADAGGLVGIHAIDGMAGIGKTTFAVHAAHKLAGRFPDGQFFLPLHAHSPGQPPVTPEDALASLLLTAGVSAQNIPPGVEARSGRWRDHVADKMILLVLDDASGHEQVEPLLPGTQGCLVLVTSRRRLTALEDAQVISLDTLSPAEAAALLGRLSGRAELESDSGTAAEITRLCGYLPLAVGMLARQLRHHPARTAAELAADLAAAHDRLAVMRTENLSVAAAFDLSYRDLSTELRRLFRRLGSSGLDVDAYATAALDDISVPEARSRLDELYDHHLITEPEPGRYLLHDLLREYARALAAGDADAKEAGGRLVNYYAHTAAAAGKHIATWTTAGGRIPPSEPPASAPEISGSEQAAAWLDSERANLHAAVNYAADVMPAHAVAIATAIGGFLRSRGHWDRAARQYRTAVSAARRAGDRSGEAGALDELGLLQQLTADYSTAMATLRQAQEMYHELGDASGEAYALNHVGLVQQDLGEFPAAAASHKQALDLALGAGDQLAEAVSRIDLGMVQQVTGDYDAARDGFQRALTLVRAVGSAFDEADVLCQLGVVQRETGDYGAAADNLSQSLGLFRRLGDRLGQSWALHEHGLVQMLTGQHQAAAASLAEALEIERALGSLSGQAWTLSCLGQLSVLTLASDEARARYREALAIAREVGAPLQEATALEGIGDSYLRDGNLVTAGAHLREALAIYERLGVTGAARVQATLAEQGI